MFNSAILDVVIGVSFVFILVSTMCAAIREGLESWLKTRSSYLEHAIREVLHDRSGTALAKSFYEHPLVNSLYQGNYTPKLSEPKPGAAPMKPPLFGKNLPSYIPARTFALALIDIAARGPATDAASSDPGLGKITLESLRASVGNLQNPAVQRIMLGAFDVAENNLESVIASLEGWYNGSMDRVSGWYKRTTQYIVLGIAVVVVGALNVNTFVIVDHLYRDETLRKTVVAAAQQTSEKVSYEEASASLQNLTLPIGWSRGWSANPKGDDEPFEAWNDLFAPIIGLLITAVAAMLGAPFWFDVLNKMMVIRATVKPREKSQEEGSEDRAQIKSMSKDRRSDVVPAALPTPAPALGPSVAPPSSVAASRPQVAVLDDDDDGHDGCDHGEAQSAGNAAFTNDEELPAAQGGVA